MRTVTPGGIGFPHAGFSKQLKLILFDVDGVLTDGRISMDDDGKQTKFFYVRDGSSMKWLVQSGLKLGIITGRTSKVVEHRAAELGIPPEFIMQGAKKKMPAYESLLQVAGVKLEETAFVGDDLIDLPVLRNCGLPACPGDAEDMVKEHCRLVASKAGGRGAVRQICEWILKDGGWWEDIEKRYLS